jgi:hypothetical protein
MRHFTSKELNEMEECDRLLIEALYAKYVEREAKSRAL